MSTRDVLASVLLAELVKHAWDGVACQCSCGAVPPVVEHIYAFQAHCAQVEADALLESGFFAHLREA